MAVTLPYSENFGQYGSFSSLYTWYVLYYQYPTNNSTITSNASFTVNSRTTSGSNIILSISIWNYNVISRLGTSGYTAPTFTYTTTPTFRLNNVNTGESIIIYNTGISTTVADNGVGTTTSGTITHSSTIDVTVPSSWFTSNLTISVSEVVLIVDTAATQTNTFTGSQFAISIDVQRTFTCTVNWANDSNNAYGTRPASVNFYLYKNGAYLQTITVSSTTWTNSVTITALDSDTFNLDYATTLTRYTPTINSETQFAITITNTLQPFTQACTITVNWVSDSSNQFSSRPASLSFNVYKNGILNTTKTVTGSTDTWTLNFNISRLESDTWNIDPNYTLLNYQVAIGSETQFTITMNNTLYLTSYTLPTITWVDGNNAYNTRPANITVKLYQNNTTLIYNTTTTNGGTTWNTLPLKDTAGKTYEYNHIFSTTAKYYIKNNSIFILVVDLHFGNIIPDDLFIQSASDHMVFLGDFLVNYDSNWLLGINDIEHKWQKFSWNDYDRWEDAELWRDEYIITDNVFNPSGTWFEATNYKVGLMNNYKLVTTDILYK